MRHFTQNPTLPSKAMQRGFLVLVPFMNLREFLKREVISIGTKPSMILSTSKSGNETKEKAQQAPHALQGLIFI